MESTVERRVLALVRSELDGLDESNPEGYSIGDLGIIDASSRRRECRLSSRLTCERG